jgi:peptidoglycan/LPS O-acetylase OafA/YrhL
MTESTATQLQRQLSRNSHLPALDAIRGASALLVVLAHTIVPRAFGALGVAIFFVLSGFLITWLLIREHAKTGRISLRNFYIRRTLRIFPAAYVAWAVCVAAALLRGLDISWLEAGASLVYLGDYYNALQPVLADSGARIMGITWSLGVEEKFYLIWPFLFVRYRTDLARLFRFSIVLIAAVWLYRIVLWPFADVPRDYLRYAFEARLDNIIFGCVAAVGLKLGYFNPVFDAVRRSSAAPIALVLVLLLDVFVEGVLGAGYHYAFGMTFEAALIAAILLQLVWLGAQGEWRWMEHPVSRFFGAISYSLYLYHTIVIAMVEHYLPNLQLRYTIPPIFAASISLAWLSHRFVEQPILRLKHRFERHGEESREMPKSA